MSRIEDHWSRIAGFHVQDDGDIGVVWIAHDTTANVTHLYESAILRSEPLAVIAECIANRGRWIPVAWHTKAKEFVEKLQNSDGEGYRGINFLPEPCSDSQAIAEVISREIWQRMSGSQFRVDKRVGEWLEEYRGFYRDGSEIPMDGYPLMAATRHAIEMLHYAKQNALKESSKLNYPKVAIL